ncbi:MAG: hypothetical protein COA41_20245 [Sphingopyxis sp.]|nr:MAG: hypothetical protein COA41_20245 [Sphingopyxis sp.]
MGKVIVVSAINIIDGGALTVLEDAIDSFSRNSKETDQVIFLVSSEQVHLNLNCRNITFKYFPNSKKSWLLRIFFEYIFFYFLSLKIKPDIWVSLHDVTPNVKAKKRFVYCHNPSPFLDFPLKDIPLDPKQFIFSILYKYLYRINIKKNNFVITQQSWIAKEFSSMYGVNNFLIAEPDTAPPSILSATEDNKINDRYSVFYPAYPRYFKNHDIIYKVASSTPEVDFILTITGDETKYIRNVNKTYQSKNIKRTGRISRQEVYQFYNDVDALIFPSLLETWGLPLTEFKHFNKPIIAADLPYAHETLGDYNKIYWFDPHSESSFKEAIARASRGANPDKPVKIQTTFPKLVGWDALTKSILEEAAI